MILKYVLKNFRRRKVRTILMVLSLMVSTGLIVALSATVETMRRSNVDVISAAAGRFDISVQRTEISPDPFVEVAETSQIIRGASDEITAVYPRFLASVELAADNLHGTGQLIGLDPAQDDVGIMEVISGTYEIGNGKIAILEETASTYGLEIGDRIEVAYSFPQPREEGHAAAVGSSQRRAVDEFEINGIVRQNGVVDSDIRQGVVMHIDDAQTWLGLPNRASQLIVLIDQSIYESNDAEAAALGVRDITIAIQSQLDDTYAYALSKAIFLDQAAQGFLILQALINTYGLLALGVVGLLVYTLVMTNVQEQRREMAVLRILGSQRSYLFAIVIVEVIVIGIVGVSLGVILGQQITQYLVVPFIESQLSQQGVTATIKPSVSVTTLMPPVISAFTVLLISAIKPAQDASHTKVMHAINPGVADNIQLEDLDQLREKRPSLRLFIFGLFMMFTVTLVIGLDLVSQLGNPALEATIFFGMLIFMVVGLGLVFFILARPLEKLILSIVGLVAPRLTYFAKRNVSRSTTRNTLISLLVLFSGILPSFLATQSAISNANIETDVRLRAGAPIELNTFSRFGDDPQLSALSWLKPSFIEEELLQIPGIETAVGMTHAYQTNIKDPVGMRNASVNVVGLTGDLNDVLYTEYIIVPLGGPEALSRVLESDTGVIISEGLANVLAVPLGGKIKLEGEGLDHEQEVTVVGIAQRVPGFSGIGRMRTQAFSGSTVFMSLDGYRQLSTNPQEALPPLDTPILDRILAKSAADANDNAIQDEMYETFGKEYAVWFRLAEVQLEWAQQNRAQEQVFLLVLTLISFTTAVFGVFAVIYVAIYSRRLEIGMMKAVGTRNWELTGMLSIESIAMALSAALAGILAGSAMAYLFAYMDNITSQRPQQFAIDTTVMPFVVIMVVFASILGTTFSARRIVKRKAVEILRMS